MTRVARIKTRDADDVATDIEAGKDVTSSDVLMLTKMYRSVSATAKAQRQVIRELGERLKTKLERNKKEGTA